MGFAFTFADSIRCTLLNQWKLRAHIRDQQMTVPAEGQFGGKYNLATSKNIRAISLGNVKYSTRLTSKRYSKFLRHSYRTSEDTFFYKEAERRKTL